MARQMIKTTIETTGFAFLSETLLHHTRAEAAVLHTRLHFCVGRELGSVAYGTSFIGGDAVAALQESFGVLRLHSSFEHFEAMLFGGDTSEGLIADGGG